MEIHDLYSLDIFLQGTFLLICLAIGLYLVFNDNLEKLNTTQNISQISSNLHQLIEKLFSTLSFKDFLKEPKAVLKLLGIVPIFVISSFILGVLGYGIADEWVDSKSKNHLFLKPLWISDLSLNNDYIKRIDQVDKKIDTFSHYKKRIRYKSFLDIFNPDKKINARTIEQLYFHAKHEILKEEHYHSYLRKSQSIAEYSRVFMLGFFILFICGLFNFCVMIIRIFCFSKKELIKKYKDILAEKGVTMHEGSFDVPDLVIIIFNLASLLAILVLVGSDFANISTYNWYIFALLIFFSLFGCFTFFLNFWMKFRVFRFSFFIYSIFYVVSFLGYYGSAKMWVSSERIVSKKVFGLYKSMHLSPDVEEAVLAVDVLKLDLFEDFPEKEKELIQEE